MRNLLIAATAALLLASPAQATSDSELEEMAALLINLNGHLCASVTEIRGLDQADHYEVTCIEYRGGSGKVRYIMNARTGVAFEA